MAKTATTATTDLEVQDARHTEALQRLARDEADRAEQAERQALKTRVRTREVIALQPIADRAAAVAADLERQITDSYADMDDEERAARLSTRAVGAVAKLRERMDRWCSELRLDPDRIPGIAFVTPRRVDRGHYLPPLDVFDGTPDLPAVASAAESHRNKLRTLAKAAVAAAEQEARQAIGSAARSGEHQLDKLDPFGDEARRLPDLPDLAVLLPMLNLADLEAAESGRGRTVES